MQVKNLVAKERVNFLHNQKTALSGGFIELCAIE